MSLIDIRGFVRKHSRILSGAALALAVVLIFWTVNNPAIIGASATTRQLPVYCVERSDKVVALSFDAAWGNEDTQQLIDILNKYEVNATFFLVGDWVDKYPESVKALADNGNEVMNHSTSHAHFSKLSANDIVSDISSCNDKIEAITGVRPTLFRCPYGEYDDHVISAIRSIGMEPIQWDVEALAAPGSARGASDTRAFCRLSGPEGRFKIQLLQIRRRIHIFLNRVLVVPHLLPENISRFKRDGYFFNKFIVI